MRRRADFVALGRARRRGVSGPVRVAHVPGGTTIAVAYAVARRAGNAVVRNRIRRRLRPVIVDLAATGRLPAGSYLVSATAAAAELPSADLRAALETAVSVATGGPGGSGRPVGQGGPR